MKSIKSILVHTVANEKKSKRGEPLTLEDIQNEINEVQEKYIACDTRTRMNKRLHLDALYSALEYRKNHPLNSNHITKY